MFLRLCALQDAPPVNGPHHRALGKAKRLVAAAKGPLSVLRPTGNPISEEESNLARDQLIADGNPAPSFGQVWARVIKLRTAAASDPPQAG